MKTRTLILGLLATSVVLGMTSPLAAQVIGLPVMDTAGLREQGSLEIMPGATFGSDMNFYGARGQITIMDELRAFLDVGRLDAQSANADIAVQGGALWSIPMTEMCDTAIRGTLYYANTDFINVTGGNVMALCSDETLLDDLYVYGGGGLDLAVRKVPTSSTELNPILAAGLSYKVTDRFHIFLETDYVDALSISCGLSIR